MIKKSAFYLMASFAACFLLVKSIEAKNEIIFWLFLIIMTISVLIAKWNGYSSNQSTFLKIIRHLSWVCAIALFLAYLCLRFNLV